jgi:Yip1 domain
MNLVERVKAIVLQPKSEWQVIEGESGDPAYLYPNYVAILAAIPQVCSFIGLSLFGYGGFRVGIVHALIYTMVIYLVNLAAVYVMALVIDFLAGTFGAQRNFAGAMKVAVYSPTPAWVIGVVNLIPWLSFLTLLGLYSLYLLYTGIAALMKPAADKTLFYTIAVVACLFVIWLVLGGIVFAVFGMRML